MHARSFPSRDQSVSREAIVGKDQPTFANCGDIEAACPNSSRIVAHKRRCVVGLLPGVTMSEVIQSRRIGGLTIRRVERDPIAPFVDSAGWSPKDDLPDLEPAEDRLRQLKNEIFLSNRIRLTQNSAMEDVLVPELRAEHHDAVARATVYVMTMIVLVFVQPVGLCLLFFNIVGGENLRTTAHVLALTGLAMVLANTPQGADLIDALLRLA